MGNNIDFGARILDPRAGRFLSVDALSGLYPGETPFAFAGNNPTNMTDFNGYFRISPWFAKRYPTLALMLERIIPLEKNDLAARDRWISKLGITDVALGNKLWDQMLTYGSGPYVTPERPDDEFAGGTNQGLDNNFFGDSRGGEFDAGYPNNITMGFGFPDDLEGAMKKGDDKEVGYRMFLVYIMLMHEGSHWAVNQAGLPDHQDFYNEDGAVGEEAILGQRFTYTQPSHARQEDQSLNVSKTQSSFNSNYKSWPGKHSFQIPNLRAWIPSSGTLKRIPAAKGQAGDPTLKANGDDESGTPPKRDQTYDYHPRDDYYYPKNN